VAFFGTAPSTSHATIARHLDEVHGARVEHVSGVLSDREALRHELSGIEAETFVIELKAAAVDVVVEEAVTRGVRIVLATNDLEPLAGEPAIDMLAEALASQAVALGSGSPA
jgi:cyclic 2,3-diphosphoglycerate synthetase